MTSVDPDPARDDDTPSPSGARFFPIGFGLGAVAALALFLGYRVVSPDAGDAVPGPAASPSASGVVGSGAIVTVAGSLPAAEVPVPDDPSTDERVASDDRTDAAATNDAGDAYTASAPDVAAATPDAPDLAGLEALASLNGGTEPGEIGDDTSASTTFATGTRLPSIDDPETTDLFGGPVMMVSSSVPRVIVLADGTSLVPGGTLPGGHRIVDIRRERILLERDGVEWRVQIP